jgi:hypothetical protein
MIRTIFYLLNCFSITLFALSTIVTCGVFTVTNFEDKFGWSVGRSLGGKTPLLRCPFARLPHLPSGNLNHRNVGSCENKSPLIASTILINAKINGFKIQIVYNSTNLLWKYISMEHILVDVLQVLLLLPELEDVHFSVSMEEVHFSVLPHHLRTYYVIISSSFSLNASFLEGFDNSIVLEFLLLHCFVSRLFWASIEG